MLNHKMTKKEELLIFCESNLDGSKNKLRLFTIIDDNQQCFLSINTPKERTIEIITTKFDDELLGSMPNDSVIHQIQSWEIVLK